MKKWKQLAFIFMLTLSLVTFSACGIGKNDADKQDSTKQETTDTHDKKEEEKEEEKADDREEEKKDDQTQTDGVTDNSANGDLIDDGNGIIRTWRTPKRI